jgi:hypothetical protein
MQPAGVAQSDGDREVKDIVTASTCDNSSRICRSLKAEKENLVVRTRAQAGTVVWRSPPNARFSAGTCRLGGGPDDLFGQCPAR